MFPHERKLQQIQQQRLMVEQLRREASINRVSVSQVSGQTLGSLQLKHLNNKVTAGL